MTLGTFSSRFCLGLALATTLGVASLDAQVIDAIAPSTNTTPDVWYESNTTGTGGAVALVDLSGLGGNLELSQPLPGSAAQLSTTTDNGDRAHLGIFDAYGSPDDIFSTLSLSYSYHKASNGIQNLAAAPALKLTFFNSVCDDPASAGDCFGLLVFEPTWNQPGFEGSSVSPPLDTWQTFNIDENTGLFWWTGGFGQPNTAGGPPLMTLAQWRTAMSSDFGDSTLGQIEIGVGSFNQNQLGYVDDVKISHSFGGGYSRSFDFELPPSPFDQNVTPEVIFGSGNANGGFTVDRQNGVELGLRAKVRFPSPMNVFNSNGDGTYTFIAGAGAPATLKPTWSFEWTANTDYDGSSGFFIDDLTYELGIDYDETAGTNYLVFDPISVGSVFPYTPPSAPVPFWDHAIGDNSTINGGGTSAGDAPTYASLVGANNVVQNSWRMDFFDEFPFDVFDPEVPGRYDFYLAASSGGTEVARTEITVLVIDGATLSLEANLCQTDQDAGTGGVQMAVELWLRNPDDVEVTGFQAFLDFDDLAMTYEGAISNYTAAPFEIHIQPTLTASVAAGELRLDGNTFSAPGPTGDALLATLFFTVTECDLNSVAFDLTQLFESELSFSGSPIITDLLDSPSVKADDTAPVLTPCPADITQSADAGSCTEAVVSWTDPTATDNCDPSPTVVCSPASGSTFSVGTTTVTCTATDSTGNTSSCTFVVTVTATNDVDIVVELAGSDPTSRCIHFQLDTCTVVADVTLSFVGAPATATATIKVPCGVWTSLCAKDQQHTKWDTSALTIVGAKYVASTTFVLDGGDTDDDGDVDINDVTLFLAQFGDVAASGGCPFDGVTKDTDFSNNGAVGSEDYVFLTANWLTTSSCGCTLSTGGMDPPRLRQSLRVHNAMTAAADLNGDGVVNVRDVELFELRYFLSGQLSERMRSTQR